VRRALAALAVAAVACGGSAPAPAVKRPPSAPVAQKPLTPEPLAPEEAKDTFVYSPIGKRDPFRSPIDDLLITTQIENHCPLCRWDVDQLKLVAVVTGTGSPVAMVEDPNGVGHMLRQGTAVGKLGGKVTSIQRDLVVVTETAHDPFGKLVQNHSQLKIEQAPPDQGSASPSLLNE
jgi:type IV pilus assembly protein PilP